MVDGCVYMMRPLRYSIVVVVPMILQTFFSFRYQFSTAYVLRYHRWQELLHAQWKQCAVQALLYAGIFIAFCCLMQYGSGVPFYNWDMENSYFAWQAKTTMLLHPAEVIGYLWLMCAIRNFFIQSILLFFMWLNAFLPGVMLLCVISCFEIAQAKVRIFYWLISPDYSVWSSRGYRIDMMIGICLYIMLGIKAYRYVLRRKELLAIEKN